MYTKAVAKDIWWALVLRGVATVVFGVAAVFWPGLTMTTLVYLFSAYILVSGIVNVMGGVLTVETIQWWFLAVLLGAFELGVGVYLLRHTDVSFMTFILLIGFALIGRGIVELASSIFEAADSATNKALNLLAGVAALITGVVVLFQNEESGVAFVWLLGVYALVAGTIHMALSAGVRETNGRRSR